MGSEEAREYLLIKRGLYYGPDNRGYTGIKEKAGRYTQAEGEALLDCDVTYMHENDAPMFSQACWDDVKVNYLLGQIADLQTKATTAREQALREAEKLVTMRIIANAECRSSDYLMGLSDAAGDIRAALLTKEPKA